MSQFMSLFNPTQTEQLIAGLAGPGWAVLSGIGAPGLREGLRRELDALRVAGRLKSAGIGQGGRFQHNDAVRRDSIAWLDESAGGAQAEYLAGIAVLSAALNRELYLGLNDAEAHFAHYAPGAFYQRHLDRFVSDGARTVSTVYYLNPSWSGEDGGCLEIYDPIEPLRRVAEILPEDGVFACFLSDRIWHGVAPTKRERASIAGWLRRPALL